MLIQTQNGGFIDSDEIIYFGFSELYPNRIILETEGSIKTYAMCDTEEQAKKLLSNLVHKIVFSDEKILYFKDIPQETKKVLTVAKPDDYTVELHHGDNVVFSQKYDDKQFANLMFKTANAFLKVLSMKSAGGKFYDVDSE